MSAIIQPGLPTVGPQPGEPPENERHRRGILRNVPTTAGPQTYHGISNLENIQCYMIATVQAILHHSRVAQFCRYHHIGPRSARPNEERLEQHSRTDWAGQQTACGYCQFYELLVRYWTRPFENDEERKKEINSRFQKLFERYLNACLVEGAPEELISGGQQDAVAAYRALISWLRGDPQCERGGPSGDASTALFLVRTSKQLECTQCHSPRNRPPATDNYELHLSFPHVSAKHFPFKELLSHNFFAEVFLRCGNCPTEMWNDPQGLGDKRQGESFNEVTKIVHFPELLCMSLNMYENDSQGRLKRIKHSVDIPLDLDLSHRSDVKAKKGAIKYRLCSVIKHQGKSPSKGHYICYSRAPKTTDWYLCDDFECIKSDFTHATKFSSKEIPYLLFFERIYEQNKGRSEVPHDSEEFEKPAWWKDTTIGLEQQPQHVTNQPGSIVEVARSDTSNPVEDKLVARSPITIPSPTTIGEEAEEKKRQKSRRPGVDDDDYIPSAEQSEEDVISDDGVDDLINEIEEVVEQAVEQEFEKVREDVQAPEKNKAHKKPHLGPKDSTYRPSKDDNADDDDDEDENPPIQPRAKVDQTAKTQQDKEPTQDVQERQLGSQPDLPDPSSTVQGVEHDGDRPRRKSVRVKVKSQKDVNMVTVPAKAGKKTTAKKTAKKPRRKPAKTAAIAASSETEAAYSKKTVVQLKALMKNRKVTVARGDRKADLIAKLVAEYKMKQGGMTEETTENPPARKKSVPRGRPLGAKNKKTAKTSGRKRSAPQDDDDDVVAVQQAQKPKRIRKLAIKRAQPMVEEDLTEQAEQAKENIEDQVLEEQNEPTTTRGRRGTKRASEADNDDARVGRSKRQKAKKN